MYSQSTRSTSTYLDTDLDPALLAVIGHPYTSDPRLQYPRPPQAPNRPARSMYTQHKEGSLMGRRTHTVPQEEADIHNTGESRERHTHRGQGCSTNYAQTGIFPASLAVGCAAVEAPTGRDGPQAAVCLCHVRPCTSLACVNVQPSNVRRVLQAIARPR